MYDYEPSIHPETTWTMFEDATISLSVPPGWEGDGPDAEDGVGFRFVVVLEFTDALDQRWRRIDRGKWTQLGVSWVNREEPLPEMKRLFPAVVLPETWRTWTR